LLKNHFTQHYWPVGNWGGKHLGKIKSKRESNEDLGPLNKDYFLFYVVSFLVFKFYFER